MCCNNEGTEEKESKRCVEVPPKYLWKRALFACQLYSIFISYNYYGTQNYFAYEWSIGDKVVLNKYIEPGSVVWTDSFSSYNTFSMNGYIHGKVDHSENFMDPNTGVHTQGIERAWLDAKDWYKSARGNRKYLQSHLDKVSWRKLRAHHKHQNTLFAAFLQDLRNSFSWR